MPKNVLGTELQACCFQPMTGYFRDGYCKTLAQDTGTHVVCAVVTDDFLKFTRLRGNDLSTPRPEWQFPGLKAGDQWCLCISRWLVALKADCAPPIKLEATHMKALEFTTLDVLKSFDINSYDE